MSLRRTFRFATVAAAILESSIYGQSFGAGHQRELASNPPDLHFRLGTAAGAKAFHRGERISVVLEFSSDAPDKYKLNGATYDRSGRLPTEEWVIDRNDAADPYIDYFGTGLMGGLGGGFRSYPVLAAKPHEIELDLNEWFRFDVPGTYRLYVKSHRLSREKAAGETGDRTVQFAAVSNVIEFSIVADDAAWTEATLRAIEDVLARPEPRIPTSDDSWRFERRDLRYLATPAAVELSLRDARKTGNGPDQLLMIGARDREQAVAAFDRYLADPAVAILEWDIRLRALLTYVRKESPKPFPMYPWQMPAESDWKKEVAEGRARHEHFDGFVRAEAIRLIPAVAAKDEAARKISGDAIAAIAPTEARAALLVPPEDFGLSRDELISQFPSFPEEQQLELLGKKWDLVRGPEMVTSLKAVIGRVAPEKLPKDAAVLRVRGVAEGAGETALRRLSELSQEEAYRIIGADIASGNTRFAGFAVREMDARDMPEADAVFLKWLAGEELGSLPLIAKFGSAKLAPEMRKRYLAEPWYCAEEASFITYFVRKLEPSGPRSAGELLRRALANREGRGCHHFLLSEVAQVVWNPMLEKQAIVSLDDPDSETVASAAHVLSEHGSVAVEPFLWKRLERWSERWRNRTAESGVPESRVGPELFRGIATAKSWILDEPRRSRLRALCLDEPCSMDWAERRVPDALKIDVSNGGRWYPAAFRVGGYQAKTLEQLEEKLAQYPPGATFRWCPQVYSLADTFSPGQRDEMYRHLDSRAAARKLTIEPYVAEKCGPGHD
ncbi:MAG: hypothetical protein U0Q16_27250 [Bryobacteraceae bacterium]